MSTNDDPKPPVVNYATPPAPIPERERSSWLYRFRWLVLIAAIVVTYLVRGFETAQIGFLPTLLLTIDN